jgi:hypothetical protein
VELDKVLTDDSPDETNFKTEENNSRKSGVKNNYGLNITAPQV